MLSFTLLLFYFYQDTDLMVLMATVCCQVNFEIAWVTLVFTSQAVNFSKKDEKAFLFRKGKKGGERNACFKYRLFLHILSAVKLTSSLTPLAASGNVFIYISGATLGLKAFHCLPELVFS